MGMTQLNRKDILDKEFTVSYKGYDTEEVDHFLDLISEDYKRIEMMSNDTSDRETKLKLRIKDLEKQLDHMNLLLKTSKEELEEVSSKGTGYSDVLERLNRLEKEAKK